MKVIKNKDLHYLCGVSGIPGEITYREALTQQVEMSGAILEKLLKVPIRLRDYHRVGAINKAQKFWKLKLSELI